MTIINYVCSLGPRCHTAGFLKRNNLKKASYPFDWIFSEPEMILHCLQDDFNIFLNKEYFTIKDKKSKLQQHSFYSTNDEDKLFNHHNPLRKKDYNYFVRCITRFKDLLVKKEVKLFIFTFLNYVQIDKEFKKKILEFNKHLGTFTNNYGILCIIQYTSNNIENIHKHKFTIHDNVHFLEITTKTKSNGLEFEDNNDNSFLDKIITSTYNFDLHEIDVLAKNEEDEDEEEQDVKQEEQEQEQQDVKQDEQQDVKQEEQQEEQQDVKQEQQDVKEEQQDIKEEQQDVKQEQQDIKQEEQQEQEEQQDIKQEEQQEQEEQEQEEQQDIKQEEQQDVKREEQEQEEQQDIKEEQEDIKEEDAKE